MICIDLQFKRYHQAVAHDCKSCLFVLFLPFLDQICYQTTFYSPGNIIVPVRLAAEYLRKIAVKLYKLSFEPNFHKTLFSLVQVNLF